MEVYQKASALPNAHHWIQTPWDIAPSCVNLKHRYRLALKIRFVVLMDVVILASLLQLKIQATRIMADASGSAR